MKMLVDKSVSLTEDQLGALLGKKKLTFNLDTGYYDQRDGYTSPKKITLRWVEEEELNAKL